MQMTVPLYQPPKVSGFAPQHVPLDTKGVVIQVYAANLRSDLFNETIPQPESRVWCGFVADPEDECLTQYKDTLCTKSYVAVCHSLCTNAARHTRVSGAGRVHKIASKLCHFHRRETTKGSTT